MDHNLAKLNPGAISIFFFLQNIIRLYNADPDITKKEVWICPALIQISQDQALKIGICGVFNSPGLYLSICSTNTPMEPELIGCLQNFTLLWSCGVIYHFHYYRLCCCSTLSNGFWLVLLNPLLP